MNDGNNKNTKQSEIAEQWTKQIDCEGEFQSPFKNFKKKQQQRYCRLFKQPPVTLWTTNDNYAQKQWQ